MIWEYILSSDKLNILIVCFCIFMFLMNPTYTTVCVVSGLMIILCPVGGLAKFILDKLVGKQTRIMYYSSQWGQPEYVDNVIYAVCIRFNCKHEIKTLRFFVNRDMSRLLQTMPSGQKMLIE